MENENKNVIYTVGGIVGAALIAWGSLYTVKFVNTRDAKEKAQQEFVKQDSVRVSEYNALAGKLDSVATQSQAKDITITNQNTENNKLKHELYGLNVKYDLRGKEYADALYTIDSIKTVLNSNAQDKKALEGILQNSKIKISMLETELTDIRKNLLDQKALTIAEIDTVNMMQNYLNTYMVNKTPIKPKHAGKVYLPGNLRLLPTDVLEIKEIKALNKEYKEK